VTLGLANRVFPAGDLITETRSYLKALAETASPTSLMQMKQQAYRQLMLDLGPAMSETVELQERSVKWSDFKEGISSFLERRPPAFPALHTYE